MNKLLLSFSFFCTLLSANSQILFSEDFQGGSIPAGWSLINQDGLTPELAVSYVNNAWIVREDFNFNVNDSAAFSTSWYAPTGTANDWMVTPLINLPSNTILSWKAVAYDPQYSDGYEVRISTTTPNIAGFNAHPPLFTVAAEASTWTSHSINLTTAGYANQNVYLAWRNNSTDKFILLVDDILVEQITNYDIELSSAQQSEYYTTPISQIGAQMSATGIISNNGILNVSNVEMILNVYDGSMTNVYTGNSALLPSMVAGGSSSFTVTGFSPTTPDVYTFELITSMTEIDQDMQNDTLTYQIILTDSVYARDNGVVAGSLGIGAGNGGELGQSFEVVTTDYLTSVSFFIVNTDGHLNGQKVVGSIWNMAAGTPNIVIGQTDSVTIANNVDSLYTVDINTDYLNLTPGIYTITIGEPDSTLALANSNTIFTPGTTWVNWPTIPGGGWENTETFGVNFAKSFVLRANFGVVCFPITNSIIVTTCQPYTSPSGLIYNVSGIYNDTIQNALGCDSIITINLTIPILNNTVTDAGNGQLVSNQTSGTYQWIDCDDANAELIGEISNTFDYTSLLSGNYAVVVSENGCVDTSACIYVEMIAISETNPSTLISIYPNPTSDIFTVELNQLDGNTTIELVDAQGRMVMKKITSLNKVDFTTDTLLPGLYIVRVSTESTSTIKRLIVEKK